MTQEQYNIIVKVLRSGVPILADELTSVLQGIVGLCQSQAKEIEELKFKLAGTASPCSMTDNYAGKRSTKKVPDGSSAIVDDRIDNCIEE